jgi:ABC-type uncharacterized transport system permease subunit
MAPFGSYTRMLFVVMALLAVIAVSVARYIQTSWIGRGLRAIRDSEEAAECSGVPTLRLKLIACVVSGALMGAAGAPMPMYLSFIEPASSFSLNWGVSALAMPIALILVELLVAPFNQLSGKSLQFNFGDPLWVPAALLLLTLFVGFIAGSYPGFYLSSQIVS